MNAVATAFWLTIVAGPFETDEACERAKVLTVPGPQVRYRCHAIAGSAAPDWSPMPPKKPEIQK